MSRQGNCGGNSWARPNSKGSWNSMSLWLSGMKSFQAQDIFGSIAVLSLVLVWPGWPGWHPGSVSTGPGQAVPCRVGEPAGTSSQILISSCFWINLQGCEHSHVLLNWVHCATSQLPTPPNPQSYWFYFHPQRRHIMRRKRLRYPEGPKEACLRVVKLEKGIFLLSSVIYSIQINWAGSIGEWAGRGMQVRTGLVVCLAISSPI